VDDQLRAACADSLHVICSDGQVLNGARAIAFMSRRVGLVPGPIAAFATFGPFGWLSERLYRWVARNRPLVGRYLFRSDRGPFAAPE
jgi:predicted DCC family thiol-disulfide oxidoreductase YuxK